MSLNKPNANGSSTNAANLSNAVNNHNETAAHLHPDNISLYSSSFKSFSTTDKLPSSSSSALTMNRSSQANIDKGLVVDAQQVATSASVDQEKYEIVVDSENIKVRADWFGI